MQHFRVEWRDKKNLNSIVSNMITRVLDPISFPDELTDNVTSGGFRYMYVRPIKT